MFAEYLVKFSIDTAGIISLLTETHAVSKMLRWMFPFGNTVHFSSACHVYSRALTVSAAHSFQLDTVYDGFIIGEAYSVSVW